MTLQEILTAIGGMRGQQMTTIDTSSVQAKVDQIEWALQAICEVLIEQQEAHAPATVPAPAEEDDDPEPKHRNKVKSHRR